MPPHADVLQWEHLPFPKSLRDFQKLFPDDAACARYLEGAKWPKGFVCPYCEEKGEPFRMATRTSVLTCRACRKQTSLTVDTVMQRTHSPLTVWFWAAYLVSSMTPGMSAVQFQRQLGLSRYETAFQILHKLRAGAAGVNVATLDWCLREWRPGYRILIVEFEAKDIACIPHATDGKFRLHRCEVIAEKALDYAKLGLVKADAKAA